MGVVVVVLVVAALLAERVVTIFVFRFSVSFFFSFCVVVLVFRGVRVYYGLSSYRGRGYIRRASLYIYRRREFLNTSRCLRVAVEGKEP